MSVKTEEKPCTIYDVHDWNNEVIQQAIADHQYHLSDRQQKYVRFKHVLDVLIAAVALLILALPFCLIAIMQKISSPSEPVFFLQDRVGMHGKIFKVIKFRTMKSAAPHDVATSELKNADSYISVLGRFLRNTSIDELPQLFCVLKGDMALIGPRPLISSEYPAQYLREYYGVYSVRPGITGLAQINGRDTLNDIDKVRYDRAYVRNVCARLDMMIVFRTIGYVVKGKDIVEGLQTAPSFAREVNDNIKKDLTEAFNS